jgi:hypothetical protein
MSAAAPSGNPTVHPACARRRPVLARLAAAGLRLWIVAMLMPGSLSALSLGPASDKMPPLRPPRGLLLPSFWELHGGKVMGGAVAALLGIGGLIWWRRRPRPVLPEPPEVTARRALESLRGRTEDAALMTLVGRGLCRYVQAILALAPEEWTTEQLLAAVRQSSSIPPDSVNALAGLLRECDTRAFAPWPPPAPPALVERALQLVNRLEQERRLRSQSASGPGPAAGQAAQVVHEPEARPQP